MKKSAVILLQTAIIVFLLCGCTVPDTMNYKPGVYDPPSAVITQAAQLTTLPPQTADPVPSASKQPGQPPELISAKRDMLVLMMAYPGYISGFEKNPDGLICAVMKSGNKILYDDKIQKTFDEEMSNADLQDSLSIIYQLDGYTTLPEGNCDPGRIRPYAFLKEVYGITKKDIYANLAKADLGINKANFNKQNGALIALEAVFTEINPLCCDPYIKYSVYPLSGSFCYRYIAHTKLLSMHSFGIAEDLHAGANPSWRTISRAKGQKRIETFPPEIVHIFEKHGFIWGGKWAHFDIMHFEYRPEIILKAKYSAAPPAGLPWYYGFPDTEEVKGYISIIEGALV